MSIIKIPQERKERFSLILHPEIDYLSSSIELTQYSISPGTSGSAPLRRRPSPLVKELVVANAIHERPSDRAYVATDWTMLTDLKSAIDLAASASSTGGKADVRGFIENYMLGVSQSPNPVANSKKIYITRFDPPFSLNDVAIEKSVIRDNLMSFYESRYDLCEMAYTNYSTLNFFSAPNTAGAPSAGSVERIPDSSALIYQNFTTASDQPRPYSPSGSFSFDFYLNPRYTNDPGNSFHAGTILHLSSTFALSLISGSNLDSNGLASGFRLMLQLSHSADIPPSQVNLSSLGTYPNDLIFLSSDNTLERNKWHHCTVRWGTNSYNLGSGSLVIDSKKPDYFVVPSASIMPPDHISNSALVVGNYYEGTDNEARFFNLATLSEGVQPTLDFGAGSNFDPSFTMSHPLNAEIHEVKIYKKHLSSEEIRAVEKTSPESYKDLLFYVPPFFIPNVRKRDMLITPFQTQNVKSTKPFNETFSFGVGGFSMNLENHVKDFVTNNMPRCLHLTASTINTTVTDITATSYCYSTGSIKKRNLTILPNDNGRFKPNFELIASSSKVVSGTYRKQGGRNVSIVSLENMIPEGAIFPGLPTVTVSDMEAALDDDATTLPDDLSPVSIAGLIAGVTPESMGGTSGPILTIAQRTRDRSSNEICFFDISNLYYGNEIQKDTFYVSDPSLTGSDGKVRVTLSDNGRGGLYRSDAQGDHPKWSNVGNVLYKEGVAIIKSPSLTFFGKDCFELKMKGEQGAHVSIFNIPLSAGAFNSSSNPSYNILSASGSPSDTGKKFVYIDSLNIHDENLNVIARSNFAQPVKKRVDDSMMIRFKMDF